MTIPPPSALGKGPSDTETGIQFLVSLCSCQDLNQQAAALAEVRPQHFDHPHHQAICRAGLALLENGEPISPSGVALKIVEEGDNPAGAIALLDSLPPTPSALPELAEKLISSRKRKLFSAYAKTFLANICNGLDVDQEIQKLQTLLEQQAIAPKPKPRKFDFACYGDINEEIRPTDWLIKNVLPAMALVCLFGDPGSYKSFLALAWGCCIATNTPWEGHLIMKQGPVFIIIGEGFLGYFKRLKAWEIFSGVSLQGAPIFISTMAAQLTNTDFAAKIGDLIQKLSKKHGHPVLVIIDTLFRSFGPGDPSNTKDMALAVANIDSYLAPDCCCLIVHHTGHGNKDRGLGSIVLPAALDVEYGLKRQPDGTALLSNKKMKDEPKWPRKMELRAEQVVVSTDYEDPITSLALTSDKTATNHRQIHSDKMARALEVLKDLCEMAKEPQTNAAGEENQVQILVLDWQKRCTSEGVYTRTAFYNAKNTLEDKGFISTNGDYVVLLEQY